MRAANKEATIRVLLTVVGIMMVIAAFITKTEEHGMDIGHTSGNLVVFGSVMAITAMFGPPVFEDEEVIRHKRAEWVRKYNM